MRIELIHPMLVHFPIALLSTGVILRLFAIWFSKRPKFSFLLPASWVILSLGLITGWIAIIFGEIARDVIEQSIKNINILNEHEEHAYITAFAFTLALVIDFIRAFLMTRWQTRGWMVRRGLAIFIALFYFIGFTNLIVTGFYGATLVYEEGAAIQIKK